MFGKASRFDKLRDNGVPGPNSYSPEDLDKLFSSKRGAFLDKADRFDKEVESDVPGPGAYAPVQEVIRSGPPPSSLGLKQQLDAQRTRLEKEHAREVRKLESAVKRLEARKEELASESANLRSAAADFNKDMRSVKLKLAEVESKLEKSDAIAASRSTELQRVSNYQSKYFKLAEVHDATLREKERLEAQAVDSSQTIQLHNEKLSAAKSEVHALQSLMAGATTAYSELSKQRAVSTQAQSATLSALRYRLSRTERKLADRDAQVGELVELIRHLSAQNALLKEELSTNYYHLSLLKSDATAVQKPLRNCGCDLLGSLASIGADQIEHASSKHIATELLHKIETQNSAQLSVKALAALNTQTTFESALFGLSEALLNRLSDESHQTAALQGEMESLRRTNTEREEALIEASAQQEAQKVQLEQALLSSKEAQRDKAAHLTSLHQVQSQNRALSDNLSKMRLVESGLQADVASLEAALSDAESFQQEHQELLKRVDILVSRNSIAEEEAKYLSDFNAHILGHNNQNQKIFYVDRLRKEMSELKQRLLTAEWETNLTKEGNAELLKELDTYRAVTREPTHMWKSTRTLKSTAKESIQSATNGLLTRVERLPLKQVTNGSEPNAANSTKAKPKDGDNAPMLVSELLR